MKDQVARQAPADAGEAASTVSALGAGDDARELAERFGVDSSAAEACIEYCSRALAADPGADCDELVREFHAATWRFFERYFDPVAEYTGFRQEVRGLMVHRVYVAIRSDPTLKPEPSFVRTRAAAMLLRAPWADTKEEAERGPGW